MCLTCTHKTELHYTLYVGGIPAVEKCWEVISITGDGYPVLCPCDFMMEDVDPLK